MALTDKVYLRNHRQIVAQLDTRIPRRAFAGATLDILFSGEGLAQVDDSTQDRLIDFAEDFLDCECQSNPHCGHPERKFLRYVLELRAEGLGPEGIVDAMTAEYQLTAYPGDVLTFLDDAVRHLDALETLATVEHAPEMRERASQRRSSLEGGG